MVRLNFRQILLVVSLLTLGTLYARAPQDSSKKVLPQEDHIEGVAVITHSISTYLEALNILEYMYWKEVPPDKNAYILVVCRSDKDNPLGIYYDSLEELSAAAEILPNQSADRFHIYFYKFTADSTLKQFYYDSYPVKGFLVRRFIR